MGKNMSPMVHLSDKNIEKEEDSPRTSVYATIWQRERVMERKIFQSIRHAIIFAV